MADPISDDLAALGRRARERLPNVGVTFERLAPRHELPADRTLVALARVFGDRVARGAAGATALVVMAILVGYAAVPHTDRPRWGSWIAQLGYVPQFVLWGLALCVVMTAHRIAARIAARRFERAIGGGDALALARAMVERVASWTLGLAVAGVMAYVLVFGMLYVVLDENTLQDLTIQDWGLHALRVSTAVMLSVLMAASVSGGLLAVRRFVVDHRAAMIVGGVLLLVVMELGLQLDSGYLGAHFRHATLEERAAGVPPGPDAVRIALTCVGTVAVFLIVGGAFARRHRREVAGL